MAKIVPRHLTIDGVQMVALTEHEYESLAASRRQFGSHVVRLRMTREALISLTRAAGAMCALLRSGEAPVEALLKASAGARTSPKGLLGALEGAVEQAQRVIGKQAGMPSGAGLGPRGKRQRPESGMHLPP
ncbi:hypothetical protein ACGF8B_29660 [Streptomyces sp. NPDC047917]|uniref:hypothetical protein n=1 Tax=Streptomyces sp. NPDC047917 TaxID=3365491 RepID=UPI003718870D